METNGKKKGRVQDQNPGQEILSGESDIEEKVPVREQDLEDKLLSGEFSWIDTYSDRKSSSGLELSELAIHPLLVETRVRDLDREVY